MRSQNTSTKKKTAGRPAVIKDGRKVNLYLGINHYNFAKSQRSTMSEYIRSLIEHDMRKSKDVLESTFTQS